jgi:nucleotide-binding universal stress UspA family protein
MFVILLDAKRAKKDGRAPRAQNAPDGSLQEEAMAELSKMIAIPVDGSENALKSLDYLDLMYGPRHNLEVNLFYVLPSLPPVLTEDPVMDLEDAARSKARLKAITAKNIRIAERILVEAKTALIHRGFSEERITTFYLKKQMSVAQEICNWAEGKQADTVLMTTRGRSRIEAFFMGEVASRTLDYCRVCPVWIVEGTVKSKSVLIGLDGSKYALRAVDHAGLMLPGTDCQVTLFHTVRHLRRFIPLEVIEEAPELEKLWKHKAGLRIAPHMKQAKEMLLEAGLTENQITTKVVDGSRSAAKDILDEARNNGYGTIVLGRHGTSMVKEFFMGSVVRKVLDNCHGLAVWVVQ